MSLPCRAPLGWNELISFLAPRAIPGVETVSADAYRRTIQIGARSGWIEVRPGKTPTRLALAVDFADSAALPQIVTRVRRLFDLDADPTEISSTLGTSNLLRPLLNRRPGLRVPGAWDGFELAIRAILGQQVTVRGATTLSGRLVEEYGSPIAGGLLFPEPKTLARARFTRVGLPKARAAALRALAGACASGEVRLEPGVDPVATRARLERLPGIGDWTAQYISMRALGDRDAFPCADLGLLRAADRLLTRSDNPLRPAGLKQLAESWRPWRAYGAMHLWQSLTDPSQA